MINNGKYKIRINFDRKKELSYILGCLLGDGHICYNCECGRLYFKSIDKIWIEEIRKNLKNHLFIVLIAERK